MSMIESNYSVETSRRVTLLCNPYYNELTRMYWTLGQDNRGYQYQIALDAIPPGFYLDQIKQNQIWFVENSTTAFRLKLYAGTTGTGITVSGVDQGIAPTSRMAYGSYYSTQTQSISQTTSGVAMTFNGVVSQQRVSVVSGSKITVTTSGMFNIAFSAQLNQTDNTDDRIFIWLKKNGTDVPQSSTVVNMAKQSAGSYSTSVAAWNWMVGANVNDYFELVWGSPDSTSVTLLASGSMPFGPDVPSAIATVNQVSN